MSNLPKKAAAKPEKAATKPKVKTPKAALKTPEVTAGPAAGDAPPTGQTPEARLVSEREAFYRANKTRIDKLLGQCTAHFQKGEHDIVRAVARMLFDYYSRHGKANKLVSPFRV